MLLIIAYGNPYLLKPSLRTQDPINYYIYITIAAVEILTILIASISVYHHSRKAIKYLLYWIPIRSVIVIIICYALNMFHYLHFGFFIAWIILQILLIYLLWKYKNLLKEVYDWDDDDPIHTNHDAIELNKHVKPQKFDKSISKQTNHRKHTSSVSTVNVSINLVPPSAPCHPQIIYQPICNSLPSQHIPMSIDNSIDAIQQKEVSKPIKPKSKNGQIQHYQQVASEDLSPHNYDIQELKQMEHASDSEELYHEGNESLVATKQTSQQTQYTDNINLNRVDSMDILLANSAALPVVNGDDEMVIEMESKEGIDVEFNQWIIDTLKECAPTNDEWKEYMINFRNNNIKEDTLKYLISDKEAKEWIQLIPKIGPRIQFLQALHKKFEKKQQQHFYPTPI